MTDIATTSDLLPNNQPHCEWFSGLFPTFTMTTNSFVKLSFDLLLKLNEVMKYSEFITVPADTRTEIPISEEKTRFHDGAVV